MGKLTILLFTVSFIFFVGTVHNLLGLKKPGIYPPKQLLRKRAGSLAAGTLILLLVGMVTYGVK